MPENDNTIHIWTDGACSGNPGPGGWAAVLICGDMRKELSGGVYKTTNNRMELRAVLEGLKAVKGAGRTIVIHSDCKAIFVDPFNTGNAARRIERGVQSNADLWRWILFYAGYHKVSAEWIKGHAGTVENERCDRLAVAASKCPAEADTAYESGVTDSKALANLEAGRTPYEILGDYLAPSIVSAIHDILHENGLEIVRKQI